MKRLLPAVLTLLFALTACTSIEPALAPTVTPLPITPQFVATDIPTPVPQPIFLNIIWSFHQPYYSLDPQTGLVTRPWVRVEALRDYYSMAALLKRYPKVHATFNFSTVLLRQLDEISTGARDVYWELAARPASSLSDDDKRFILARFFDLAEKKLIAIYPRYQELLDKRGLADDVHINGALQAFGEQDIRDLQVWFNLASFGSSLLAESPLKELVAKGRDFTEDDKHIVFDNALATVRAIGPMYSELQDSAQAEISTSPYGQPILPLLLDTGVGQSGSSKVLLPDPAFRSARDADEQLKRASEFYQRLYQRPPRGLVPVHGAIAANVIAPISSAGFQWTASGENVLAKALNLATFDRDGNGAVQNADALYRPYQTHTPDGKQMALIFRDDQLSTAISTTYAALSPDAAADAFINSIHAIKDRLASTKTSSPHLVTLIVDTDPAWSLDPVHNEQLVDALYKRLSDAADRYDIQTVTPSEYLVAFPDSISLNSLPSGAWSNGGYSDFRDWIGTPETNAAWKNLYRAREFLEAYLSGAKTTDPGGLAKAYDAMLLAEGADWLQALSSAPSNDEKGYFDRGFRALLTQVYGSVGVPTPDYLQVPLRTSYVLTGDQQVRGLITPTIDGIAGPSEWDNAGSISSPQSAPTGNNAVVEALYFGANSRSIYFRVDARNDWGGIANGAETARSLRVGVYFAKPGATALSAFTRVAGDGDVRTALGMSATHVLEWSLNPDGTSTTALYSANAASGWSGTAIVLATGAAVGRVLEMSAPLAALGGVDSGTRLNMVVIVSSEGQTIAAFPTSGLAQMSVPGIGAAPSRPERVYKVFDNPTGKDHGPGTYTYPSDSVFEKGAFDLKSVTIAADDKRLSFRIEMNGPIDNVWNSPIGLSIQTFDIYVDKDPGKGTGERKLLEGRNAALPKGNGWEYALWIEGWNQQLLTPDGKGKFSQKADVDIRVTIDPAGVASIEVPLSAFGEGDPATWAYAVVVLGQEAFPSPGVRRVRDVDTIASQWHFGGGPNDTNHTRIINLLAPAGSTFTQETGLSQYPPSQDRDPASLTADKFGIVPMVTISK